MRSWLPHIKALLFMAAMPIVGIGYPLLNHTERGTRYLVTDLDRMTPFISWFAVPYVLWIPFLYICLIYFCFRDRILYYRTIAAYVIGILICYVFYFFFQTTVPRPLVLEQDAFTWLVKYVYGSDMPNNAFPSIHCFSSFLMLSAVLRSSVRTRLNSWLIGSGAILIIVSTLFIKQHVVLDALAAIAVAELAFALTQPLASPAGVPAARPERSIQV